MAENIGAAARAMKSMGLSQLTLVAPQAAVDEKARAMATHGADILDQAVIVSDIESAVADCHQVWAATARSRALSLPQFDARSAAWQINAAVTANPTARVALLFGAERTGLTNTELGLANQIVSIHADARFGVLNLAQAVQIIAYELHYAAGAPELPALPPGAPRSAVLTMLRRLEGLVAQTDFFTTGEDEPLRAQRQAKLMQRLALLFQRGQIQQDEVQIIHGMITALEKQLANRQEHG